MIFCIMLLNITGSNSTIGWASSNKSSNSLVSSIVLVILSGSCSWRSFQRNSSIFWLLRLLRSIKIAESMHPLVCKLATEWFCLTHSDIFSFISPMSGFVSVVLTWSSKSWSNITFKIISLLSKSLLYTFKKA